MTESTPTERDVPLTLLIEEELLKIVSLLHKGSDRLSEVLTKGYDLGYSKSPMMIVCQVLDPTLTHVTARTVVELSRKRRLRLPHVDFISEVRVNLFPKEKIEKVTLFLETPMQQEGKYHPLISFAPDSETFTLLPGKKYLPKSQWWRFSIELEISDYQEGFERMVCLECGQAALPIHQEIKQILQT